MSKQGITRRDFLKYTAAGVAGAALGAAGTALGLKNSPDAQETWVGGIPDSWEVLIPRR